MGEVSTDVLMTDGSHRLTASFLKVGCVYLNFGLWLCSLAPAWYVVKEIGVSIGKITDEKKSDDE